MKVLRGDELALFVKQRQAKQVRGLRQADRTNPRLAIITCGRTPVIDTYTRVKQRYGMTKQLRVPQSVSRPLMQIRMYMVSLCNYRLVIRSKLITYCS